jgi:hypothetical protein
MAMAVLDDAPDVAEEVFAAVALQNRCTVFRRKHDVVGDGGVRRDGAILHWSTPFGLSGLTLVACSFSVG